MIEKSSRFQDRGHSMTTERRAMAFFMRAPSNQVPSFNAGQAGRQRSHPFLTFQRAQK